MNNYFRDDNKKAENPSSSDATKRAEEDSTSNTQVAAENTTSDNVDNTDAQGVVEKRKIDGEDESVECKKPKREDDSEV